MLGLHRGFLRNHGLSGLMLLVIPVISGIGVSPLWADAAAGKAVFNQCAGCHAVGEGATHRFGPQLNGVFSRDTGSASEFEYSAAFRAKVEDGLQWDTLTLDAYLEAPMSYIPGTKMAYPGLASSDDRNNVIAYLATIDENGVIIGLSSTHSNVKTAKTEILDTPLPLASQVPIPEHGVLHLGRAALNEEIAAWDIDIRPDGMGLPIGQGSVEVGGELYDLQCASCHGVFGEGEGRWPVLAGGHDTLTEERPEKTIGSYWPYLSTVYDYVRRAMPFGNSRSLSDDDVYALTAYLLYLNDLVDESYVLSAENFADISMPNKENFMADTRSSELWFGAAEEPCMTDCISGEATVSQRARILDVTPAGDGDEGSGGLD